VASGAGSNHRLRPKTGRRHSTLEKQTGFRQTAIAKLHSVKLILASQSPRRRELLAILGIPFTVAPSAVPEIPHPDETAERFAVRVAREKGMDVASRVSGSVVLAADTVVTINGEILGKPVDSADAVRMLRLLSGRRHAVFTAICLINQDRNEVLEGIDRTDVWFDPLTDEQIHDYLRREDVMDKAGAYAIQGYAGVYIPKIEGNYFNVMGLPLPLAFQLLCRTLS
jgi:septum formation protein